MSTLPSAYSAFEAEERKQDLRRLRHRARIGMTKFELSKPLAWVDDDRLLIKDRTRRGLHRRMIARKGERPSAELWVEAVAIADKIDRSRITYQYAERDGFCFLWITWKEQK